MSYPVTAPPKPWSPRDIEIAAETYQRLYTDVYGDDAAGKPGYYNAPRVKTFDAIARRLARTRAQVWQRFRDNGPSFNVGSSKRGASSRALAQRQARAAAMEAASLTAQIFGDPPPGFSALDRRRSGAAL